MTLLIVGSTGPARADCVLNGTIVICSGNSPGGFAAPPGVDGLTVIVGNGAVVGTGIELNDNNAVSNLGTVSVGDAAVGILAGNNNQISSSGSIVAGDSGVGISVTGAGSVMNSGGITAGDTGVGISAANATNTGTITVGPNGFGIIGSTDFGTLINRGSIVTGDGGSGIQSDANALTVLNSGSIVFGDCGAGIDVSNGTGHTVTNSGTIFASGCGGTGILAGDSSTVTNSGAITVGDTGIGIAILGGSAVNAGTIIVGEGGGLSGGMVGFADGVQLSNTGTITGGMGAAGMMVLGNSGMVSNSGTINIGSFGLGMGILGDDGTVTNLGTINADADATGMAASGFNNIVRNAGVITVGDCGIGIDTSAGGNSTVVNSGRILGNGCSATGVALGDGDNLSNSGLVSAPFSVVAFGGNTLLTNTGTLDGTLQFDGTGGNTLTNSGLITITAPLTPGNGAMHVIDGTFIQSAAGTLAFRVLPNGGAGNYDVLQVQNSAPGTGIANLGGTLRALPQPGLYDSTTTYTGVLTFASSTGQFASVETGLSFFSASAAYNSGSIDLVLTRIPFNQTPTGGLNGQNVGNVLEAGYSTNLTGPLAAFYINLLQSSAPNTLSQLTGEVATASQTASFAGFGQFLGTTFSQTGSVRGGGQAQAPRALTSGGGTRLALAAAAADACSSDACNGATPGFRRVTAWVQGFGAAGSMDRDPVQGSSRVDLSLGGGATGIDVQLDDSFMVGVTLGTAASTYNLTDLASSGTARSVLFGVYGGYTMGAAYVDAALGYGYGTFNTSRFVGTGSISERIDGAFDGYQYGGRIEAGWRLAVERHVLTPLAGLTVQSFRQNGYTEVSRDTATGAPGMLALAVQPQTTTSVRSLLGAQLGTSWDLDERTTVSPRLRLGWAHEFNTDRSVTASLSSVLPGSAFAVTGARPASDALIVGAGLDVDIGGAVRLYAQFDGDFASTARSYAGTGGVRLFW